jgi:DNA-directed RNA polymerase specialized sigma24 family protein
VQVSNEQVAQYWDACEALARPFVGRAGAEMDDLHQEGLIFVWESLADGVDPSARMIQNRMKNWVRTLSRQRRGDDLSLEEIAELNNEIELGLFSELDSEDELQS